MIVVIAVTIEDPCNTQIFVFGVFDDLRIASEAVADYDKQQPAWDEHGVFEGNKASYVYGTPVMNVPMSQEWTEPSRTLERRGILLDAE